MKSSKGQTDYISLFFLLAILISTIIVILLTVPGLTEFLQEFLSSIIAAIIVIALGSLLTLFGVMIAGHSLTAGKTIAYIGVGVLIIGFFIIEMAYVAKMKESLATPMTVRCSGAIGGRGLSGVNAAEFVTCIITGYKYKGEYGTWAFLGFWVFGVIIPIVLFMSLFYDFVDASGVVRHDKSKKIVGYSLGLIAYRGFVVANLLEILSLGTVGIALLALNLIFLGGLLAYIHRVFERWRPIEHAMGLLRTEMTTINILKRLTDTAIDAAKKNAEDTLRSVLPEMEFLATSRPAWKNLIKGAMVDLEAGRHQEAQIKLEQLRRILEHPTQTT